MNESRIRLLNQLSSNIFAPFPSTSITPNYKKTTESPFFSNHPIKPDYSQTPKNQAPRSFSSITSKVQKEPCIISKNLPKPKEAKLEVLQITGLKPCDNEGILREIAQKFHVVEINTEFDNVKGICTGKGRIAIRSFPNENDKQNLASRLRNKGYLVNDDIKNNNKKLGNNWHPSINHILRSDASVERVCVSKENFEKNNTPRYMRPTTSFANKYFG